MRKILSTLIIAFSLLSCSDSKIYEDVLTQYEDGNHREVKYYKISKDGSRNYIKESWFYQEGVEACAGASFARDKTGVKATVARGWQCCYA